MREEIRKLLLSAIVKKYGKIDMPEFSVEAPDNPEHGDYSSNAAMVLGKTLDQKPQDVAADLSFGLASAGRQVKIAGPGFLNFFLTNKTVLSLLSEVLRKKNNYGRQQSKNKKVQVEFVSANPTGPLTLANGRGGFLGDALSNILEFSGYKVEREYYVNDTGNQIITFGRSLAAAFGSIPEEEVFYKGAYVKKWAKANRTKVKKYKDNPLRLGQIAAKDFLLSIKKALDKKAGMKFDRWTSEERHIHKKGLAKQALEIFKKKKLSYKKDGAVWLKTTAFGDDKDRVLITSDGYPTYFMADAGHYLETKVRGFDKKILILGPDHYGYVKRIQAAAKIIGFENSEIIVTQAMRLMREGKEVKMSKRGGTYVAFEDLIDEVGKDAVRFFFLERSSDTHIDFNFDLAKEQSKNNPVFYIQYAHARMQSIFRKAGKLKKSVVDFALLNSPEEKLIMKTIIRFPEIIEDISRNYQVHRLIKFSSDLARLFHDFYEKHRVITGDGKLTGARLALVAAAGIVLKNSLTLLGINAPDKM